MKHRSTLLALVAATVILAACSPQPQVVYQQQPAPVVVQQAQPTYVQPGYAPQPTVIVHDHSGADVATGMLAGAALAHAMNNSNRSYAPAPVIVNKTVINKTVVNAPTTTVRVSPPTPTPVPVARAPAPAPVMRAAPAPQSARPVFAATTRKR